MFTPEDAKRRKELEAYHTGASNAELDALNRKLTNSLTADEIRRRYHARKATGQPTGQLKAAARERGIDLDMDETHQHVWKGDHVPLYPQAPSGKGLLFWGLALLGLAFLGVLGIYVLRYDDPTGVYRCGLTLGALMCFASGILFIVTWKNE